MLDMLLLSVWNFQIHVVHFGSLLVVDREKQTGREGW
jgi:hypothetical protein